MTIAPPAAEEWDRLAADLARCLSDLAEDEHLILSYKNANYYVQFCAQGSFGMRAEAVSNAFILPVQAVLTVSDYEHMDELGWHRATNPPPERRGEYEPPDGSPNFFQDLAVPVDWDALAQLSIRTLREVYRVRHPGELVYKAFVIDGTPMRFPALRLKRG